MERHGRGWLLMRHGMREFNDGEPELISDAKGEFTRKRFSLRPDQP